ncbi:ribosomal maturation YjgA family protein [Kitasatospora cathayae]|uniref:DUF2809 domain-containing protein n=1 Tax=Kitasatospora cathayae TaxID=3004092 RepID=A0ABY7PXS1_9ACTN|nr:DUF2809 domain-containing protein [Kitasatospora sp. HUAS 3-15]WBP85243.1 DUF2809 domain-containing protein [Kitasatospora sp. HUAS 3-15]
MNDLRRVLTARLLAAAAALLTVVAGLGVRAVMSGETAKYAGDALYTVLVYALVVLVAPRVRPVRAALVAAGVSWAVELFQATGLPDAWGRRSGLVHLVLGSTFNPPDLFWYLVGAAVAALLHRVLRAGRTAAPGR